ncbi:3-keto-5-aminohexanoate cleavage protein [Mesorhizobium opportunistum]|nr:3-keto-5-aminohexanoate cleavage protein [Mesorhizobium opportunistum]
MQLGPRTDPVTIAVAPNGGRRTKADHPAIPLTAAELAVTASECAAAGAAMIHVHVRDRQGRHLLDPEAYREVITAIHGAVGDRMVVQITSEALGIYAPEAQMRVVREVRPQVVSLALRELAPDAGSEAAFAHFLEWLRTERVAPQIILYTPQEAVRLADMSRRGLIPWTSVPVLYVLGRYSVGQTSVPTDLLPFLAADMPRFDHWSVCAFGRHEAACVVTAALLGGHVRIGFENNLFLPDGGIATSNADLVAVVAHTLGDCGTRIATASDLAKQWNVRSC